MNYYFKIKKQDVTQAMLNCSTSRTLDQARKVIEKGVVFDTEWTILKCDEEILRLKPYFDSYQRYTCEEIRVIIDGLSGMEDIVA